MRLRLNRILLFYNKLFILVNFMNSCKVIPFPKPHRAILVLLLGLLFTASNLRGQVIPLQDLSSFDNPGPSWSVEGDVQANLKKDNVLKTTPGSGILVNQPTKKRKGVDLFTSWEHGDIDLSLEYMMSKSGNSGIYLQGMYEVQLMDSWGENVATSASNGGIYERWDEQRPKGQKGYQGYAPRQNVGRAPGLWQRLEISFKAPRFDKSGNKIENARIIKAQLNGVVIQEDVELFGPTHGAMGHNEVAKGPLRIQGDHGAVAFRNIKVTHYDSERPVLKDIVYRIYNGKFDTEPAYDSLPPEAAGSLMTLTSNIKSRPLKFLVRYDGVLEINEPGEYDFSLYTNGGTGLLQIGEEIIINQEGRGNRRSGKVNLNTGEFPIVLIYSKFNDWAPPAIGLSVSGPGIRYHLISDIDEMQQGSSQDPILVSAEDTPVLRSFMDLPGGHRVTHAISIGSRHGIHYTYDLDHGALVQVWRGDFLNATPMWHDRGDGSSRPEGSVQHFTENPQLFLAKLATENSPWISDTTGSGFRPKGYRLDHDNNPVFLYKQHGINIEDAINVTEDGKGVERSIQVSTPSDGLYMRLVEGDNINELQKGLYVINENEYYLRLDETAGAKPVIRSVEGRKELIVPVKGTITYSILF